METIEAPVEVVKKPRKKRVATKPRKPAVKKKIKVEQVFPAPVPEAPAVAAPAGPVITKLLDPHNRGVLCEGRNYGIAFALCALKDGVATTVGPRSPCKDYLNDQIYSEWTGKPYQAWGYKAKKEGLFEPNPIGYIGFSILPYKYGNKYPSQDKETEFLNANYASVQKFMNLIEEKLKIPATQITRTEDNMFVATVDKFWIEFPYRVSLWALLVRFAVESFWKEGDVMAAIENARTGDAGYLGTSLPKLKAMIEGKRPAENFTRSTSWHDAGIVNFAF